MSDKKPLTFATSCWEGDWEFILKTGRLETMVSKCNYPFNERMLVVNNVDDRELVASEANKWVEKGVLDVVHFTEDTCDEVLKELNVNVDKNSKGYKYLIQGLTAVYLCKSPYLLHFTCDAIVANDESWIEEGIALLDKEPKVFAVNPVERGTFDITRGKCFKETENFFWGRGFSDQCFLVKTEDCRKDIYNHYHPSSDEYPNFPGDPFEKRVNSYMGVHDLIRLTHKKAVYIHKSFPSNPIKKFLALKMGYGKKKYGL